MKKLFFPLLTLGMFVFADVSYAAFGGSRGSSGVSRSYSRPATTTFSKPATTYKAPAPSTSRQSSSYSNSNSYNSGYKSNYSNNSGYSNSNYRDTSRSDYNYNSRPSSTMRDIGVTAAGVGGGILAAQAITALVSSPAHPGMYTHPQYPGQYFNQAGVPMPAPVAAPQPQVTQQYEAPPVQQYIQPRSQQPASVVIYQAPQPKEDGITFFGFLWGVLWFLIKLAFFLSVVGAIGFGIYKLIQLGRNKAVREQVQEAVQAKVQEKFTSTRPDFNDLDAKAMDIFYDFQANSDNEAWVKANTKYLPVKDCLSAPSQVLEFQHRTLDCTYQHGKVRASVQYHAVLNDGTGEIEVEQVWNFEKDNDVWKLIGFEQVD